MNLSPSPDAVREPSLGSLNYLVEVVPLGCLLHCCLIWEGNCVFLVSHQDTSIKMQAPLCHFINRWNDPVLLKMATSWANPAPSISITIDTDDIGYGYQLSEGFQGDDQLSSTHCLWHITVKKFAMPWLFLHQQSSIQNTSIYYWMDNKVVVHCINRGLILVPCPSSALLASVLPGKEEEQHLMVSYLM